MDPKNITLKGTGQWAVCKSENVLESDLWTWWIEIEGVTIRDGQKLLADEEMARQAITKQRAVKLMRRIGPFLPKDATARVIPPDHVPGGEATIQLPLADFVEPKDAAAILLIEFFPELCRKIPD